MKLTLVKYTQDLLNRRSRAVTLQHIVDATGLTYDWLVAFGNGRISDPSANRVETLYSFLTGKPVISE